MEVKEFIYNIGIEQSANMYLLIDSNKDCLLIDPGFVTSEINDYIKENRLNLKAILLTHGHFDHIRAIKEYNCPVYMHQNDVELLANPHFNCSDRFSRKDIVIDIKPEIVEDGQEIHLLNKMIKVIHTPYHTMGSICFYVPEEKMLFSGDSLFKGTIGRCDFITSDPSLVKGSLAKLAALDDDVIIYPGHADNSTIGEERKQNPFVKR